MDTEVAAFAARVRNCWSRQTATTYSAECPARGQCSVTALLAHEVLGGELLKTRVGEAWHFYNRIGGAPVDFTSEQFDHPVMYDNVPATHAEAMRDTSPKQLAALRRSFKSRSA
ncbi:YunG family protein [Sphingomonas lenta]|uniref:Uncharacterized protein n=1 Tax=Sphingomonas lenta TaxID=1141887 RepID=A0A2A2SID7_9SPHN|nr:hypothetical protein [Sphingomonas lenta]PAX08985.1 hypothetical protein CKY28_06515 [Sphingomonas lenta]